MTTSIPYRPCVGLMLLSPEKKIFCGERRDTPGAWQMPQGGIHKNEPLEEAAFRELREEIGVTQARIIGRTQKPLRYDFPDVLMQNYRGKYRGQEQHWFALQFLGEDSDIDLISHCDAKEGPEFVSWRWCSADEVVANIVPFKRDVYEAVVAEFSPILGLAEIQ